MATIGKSGRLVIPAALRKSLNLNEGDGVTLAVKDGHIEISPVAVSIHKAPALVKKHLKPENDLVKMLFEERHEAIQNEH